MSEIEAREVIRRLKVHFEIHDDGRPTPKLDEAEQLAYKALEKQIPNKPTRERREPIGTLGLPYYENICPNCEEVIDNVECNYCSNCGQRLDWED